MRKLILVVALSLLVLGAVMRVAAEIEYMADKDAVDGMGAISELGAQRAMSPEERDTWARGMGAVYKYHASITWSEIIFVMGAIGGLAFLVLWALREGRGRVESDSNVAQSPLSHSE